MLNRPLRNTILYNTPATVWGILILYFSLLPSQSIPPSLIEVSDLFLHVAIYAAFTSFYFGGNYFLNNRVFLNPSKRNLILAIVILISALIEVVQEQWIPGRSGEWLDLLANFSGALLGTVIVKTALARWVKN